MGTDGQHSSPPPVASRHSLSLAAADFELGTLIENEPRQHTLTLTNPGDRPVTLLGVDGPCDTKRHGVTFPVTIPAGGQHQLRLSFTPSESTECGRIKGAEEYAPVVAFHYNDGGRVRSLRAELHGVVKPTLAVAGITRGHLVLGEQLAEALAEPRDFSLVGAVPIRSVAVSCQGLWVGEVRGLEAVGRFVATVRRVPHPGTGVFDDLLTFTPTGSAGQPLPPTHLRLSGEVVDRVVAHPRDVRLGRLAAGQPAEDTFRLRSVDGRAVRVTRVTAPPGVQVLPVGKAGNQTFVVRLTAVSGDYSGTISVQTADADGHELAVSVAVTYQGCES